jgi:hypothetical protein
MRSKMLAKFTMLLLAACCMPAMANELPPASLETQDAAPAGNAAVYISQERKYVAQIGGGYETPMPLGHDFASGAMAAALWQLGNIANRRKITGLPPIGNEQPAPGFRSLNKIMQDGVFFRSINEIMAAPFQQGTWLNEPKITAVNTPLSEPVMQQLLRKRQKKENLPDTAVAVRSVFVFPAHDYYKLWFITDIEMYEVQAKGKSRIGPFELKRVHREKFASLYDISDHFEIPEPDPENKDWHAEDDLLIEFWTKDDGKIYFAAASQLATQNAKMISYFLRQPPSDIARGTRNAAVMALYEIKPEAMGEQDKKTEDIERAAKKLEKKQRKEQLKDGKTMEKLNPVERKVYMLGKEYEYTCLVDIIEAGKDRVITRDQDRNIHYSLPGKHMKLVMQSEIDANEYTPTVLEYQEYRKHRSLKDVPTKHQEKAKIADAEESLDDTEDLDMEK